MRRPGYAWAAVGTVAGGAAVRFARLGLPGFVVKYGGSALWAAAIFWMLSAARPRWHARHRAGSAMGIAAAIEFFKRVQSPGLDALRGTLFGTLVLGRYFAWADLAAYAVGIGVMTLLEAAATLQKAERTAT